MLFLRFPFRWGAPAPAVVVPVVEPPVWNAITVSPDGWRSESGPRIPQFSHLYPQQSANQQWKKGSSP